MIADFHAKAIKSIKNDVGSDDYIIVGTTPFLASWRIE